MVLTFMGFLTAILTMGILTMIGFAIKPQISLAFFAVVFVEIINVKIKDITFM